MPPRNTICTNIEITFGDCSSTELEGTINLSFQTFDKRFLKTPGCADEAQAITVTDISFIEKPSGLVNQGEFSISRTIIEAPTGSGTTISSSNSSVSSPAKTTFATRAISPIIPQLTRLLLKSFRKSLEGLNIFLLYHVGGADVKVSRFSRFGGRNVCCVSGTFA
jgi:hypothetical protein